MPPSQDTKKAKREAARQARIEAQRARERARKRKRLGLLAVVAAVLLLAGMLIWQNREKNSAVVARAARQAGCSDVRTFAEQDRDHIEAGVPKPKYNSKPPTSGPHRAQTANWGSYDERVDDETLVHNLEHGGIVIHYKDLSDARVDRLSALADRFDNGVIAQPNPDITKPIAMTAWRTLRTCDGFSEPVVEDFIATFCNKGPEKLNLAC